jgi:hypothetical protein
MKTYTLTPRCRCQESRKSAMHDASPTRGRGRIAASPSLARRARVPQGLVPEEFPTSQFPPLSISTRQPPSSMQ